MVIIYSLLRHAVPATKHSNDKNMPPDRDSSKKNDGMNFYLRKVFPTFFLCRIDCCIGLKKLYSMASIPTFASNNKEK
jgi:hypothetical protein